MVEKELFWGKLYNIMKFPYLSNIHKHMKTTEYGTKSIHNLSTGQHKIIRMYEKLFVEIVKGSFSLY